MSIAIAAEAVRVAQARADKAGLVNTRFVCGSVTDALPVEAGSAGSSPSSGSSGSRREANATRNA